jgi:hypothetical protein
MTKLEKYRLRLNGLLIEKVDDINDALSQFPKTDEYVKLKIEEKQALQFALKLVNEKIKEKQK